MAYEQAINTGDTAFLFTCVSLVQFMCPGLAFFDGGMGSKKNVIAMIMQNYASMGIVTMLWFFVAFSLCFGESLAGTVGNPLTYPMFVDLPLHRPFSRDGAYLTPGIPGSLFAGYQCMFAIITPPMMSGGFADRFRFGPYLVFISLWLLLVYCPVCHWTWGGGWMARAGIADWAGGLPVHITAGFSSLASLFFVGRRFQGKANRSVRPEEIEPHSVPFIALGTAILWFGWFGFNGGMGYLSNGVGMLASVNTQFCAASASVGWIFIDVLVGGRKPSLVGFCVGALSGLSAISPTAGYIQPYMAMLLGFMAAIWCWLSCRFAKTWTRCGIEDCHEVWGVYGMGGFLGVISVGLLADGPMCADIKTAPVTCANPGIVTRSFMQFLKQFSGAATVAVYSVVMTFGLLTAISLVLTIRPPSKDQLDLDMAEHGELAYAETQDMRVVNGGKSVPNGDVRDNSTTGSRRFDEMSYSSSHYDEEEEEEYGEGEEEEEEGFSSRVLARFGYQQSRGAYTAVQ